MEKGGRAGGGVLGSRGVVKCQVVSPGGNKEKGVGGGGGTGGFRTLGFGWRVR